MKTSRNVFGLLALTGLMCLVGVVGLWLFGSFRHGARLVRMSVPNFSGTFCLGMIAPTGPTLNFVSDWVIEADVVQVLYNFSQNGWAPITHMTTSIELLPLEPTTLSIGLAQIHVYQAVSLSYTQERSTQITASTSVVFCPPE